MKIDDVRQGVAEIIGPVITSMGIELVSLDLKKMGRKGLLRVFIDREGGVTIDDCERVSREIEAVLDVEDPIPYSYVLEVSSPGLDRPLKSPADFRRFAGQMARVVTIEPVGKQTFFVGSIANADDEGITLSLPKDRTVAIAYGNISKARLEVEI